MTVKEMIEILKYMDENKEVYMRTNDGRRYSPKIKITESSYHIFLDEFSE